MIICDSTVRTVLKIAIVTGSTWMMLHPELTAAETFEERWSIVPKANAAPSSKVDESVEPPIKAKTTPPSVKRTFVGKASYYSYGRKKTASGFSFDRNALTAAHRSLPFGTTVRVTDLATRKSVEVIITDRGPRLPGRMLDLSLAAARTLGITDRGVVPVRAEVLEPALN